MKVTQYRSIPVWCQRGTSLERTSFWFCDLQEACSRPAACATLTSVVTLSLETFASGEFPLMCVALAGLACSVEQKAF